MSPTENKDFSRFFMAGISYKCANESLRGRFAISAEQYQAILDQASFYGVESVFVISTCNRTEIYGLTEDPSSLIGLLCSETIGSEVLFSQLAYTKGGSDAVSHLFNLFAGLDSQIIGDYEIVGQLKLAVKFARDRGKIGPFMDRLINMALAASKRVKTETSLSNGSVSVAFAAVKYLAEKTEFDPRAKIVILGIGKIGRNCCKNLVGHLGARNITVVNRSAEKAICLAAELGLNHAPISELKAEICSAAIVIVATNAVEPILLTSFFVNAGVKIVLDLSMPSNLEDSVTGLSNVTLVQVDELSKLKDESLRQRVAQIPLARAIIAEFIIDFQEWAEMHRHGPALRAAKAKLGQLRQTMPAIGAFSGEKAIDIAIKGLAVKMRKNPRQPGCHYIEMINNFMQVSVESA